MIQIIIENQDQSDLRVTVIDLLTADGASVMNGQLISVGAQCIVMVQSDGTGYGKVQWTAISVDDMSQSRTQVQAVASSDIVYVTTEFA
jgi:hypothetical protein